MGHSKAVSLLVIEQDEAARAILVREIKFRFADTQVDVATSPEEALRHTQQRSYEVIVCAAHMLQDQKISFLTTLCESDKVRPQVVAVTAHTDVNLKSFPAEVRGECVQHVFYMPVDLTELLEAVGRAIAKASGSSS